MQLGKEWGSDSNIVKATGIYRKEQVGGRVEGEEISEIGHGERKDSCETNISKCLTEDKSG